MLKEHLDTTTVRPELPPSEGEQLRPVKHHAAGAGGDKPGDHSAQGGFAAAGFPHEPIGLSRINRQGDTVYRPAHASGKTRPVKGLGQISNLKRSDGSSHSLLQQESDMALPPGSERKHKGTVGEICSRRAVP